MKLFSKKIKDKRTGVKIEKDSLFDYSTLETREATIRFLFSYEKINRSEVEDYWQDMKRYYDGIHDTTYHMNGYVSEQGLPWTPTQCEEGFITVETQIDPSLPSFEFSGRDDSDDDIAKQREYVCNYIIDNNTMENMNTRNERMLNKYGTGAWKVSFDMGKKMGGKDGNIAITNPHCNNIFVDSSAIEGIDDGMYAAVVYRMHKIQAGITFANDLKRMGKTINEYDTGWGLENTEFLGKNIADSAMIDKKDFTVQITEWYFRQPQDGSENINGVKYSWKAGDIGLIILINDSEIRYNPKYWFKTNCSMFPVVLYSKIPNDNSIWGKSEIEPIKNYIDTIDRKMSYAELNESMSASDIVVTEENAFAENSDPKNVPGALWVMKPGMLGAARRLGGLASNQFMDSISYSRDNIQRITGSFDAAQGAEPERVTTTTGLAIMNDKARGRQNIKKVDVKAAWERLLKLCDYTALEFFNDDRLIYIGAKDNKEPVKFTFNSDDLMKTDEQGQTYYPDVDVKINIGDGLKHNKAFTIQVMQELLKTPITPENYKIIMSYLDILDIPSGNDLKEFIQQKMEQQPQPQGMNMNNPDMEYIMSQLSPEEQKHVQENPQILEQFMPKQQENAEGQGIEKEVLTIVEIVQQIQQQIADLKQAEEENNSLLEEKLRGAGL